MGIFSHNCLKMPADTGVYSSKSNEKSNMRKGAALVTSKPEPFSVAQAEKKPYIEIAVVLAALQLAIVIALYLVGHGSSHRLVTAMDGQSSWYLAETSTMISEGAFICVNKFFEHIELVGLAALAVVCVFVLIGAGTMWTIDGPRKFGFFFNLAHSVSSFLERKRINLRSWKILGIGSYKLSVLMYVPVFGFVLFVILWSFGASVGRDSAKEMKELWSSVNHSSSSRFITITADDKVFCGMHIASSPRGHIVWNGKSAMLLPFDSTSFEAKCAAPPKA